MASKIFPWFGWVMTEEPKTVGELRDFFNKAPKRFFVDVKMEGHPSLRRTVYDCRRDEDCLTLKIHDWDEGFESHLERLLTYLRKSGYNLGITKENISTDPDPLWRKDVYHIKALNLTFVSGSTGIREIYVGDEKIPIHGDYGLEDELLENDDKAYWKRENAWRVKNEENPEEKLEQLYQQEEAYPWNKTEKKENFNPAKI